ncbi:MAG: acyltransferase [Chitinophagales bacterium]
MPAEKPTLNTSDPNIILASWRGVAAILIFTIHYRLQKYNLPSALGYTGTHSFFLLSAYFVSLGLFKKFENKDINAWKTFKDFIVKRILKIMPVYFLYIFLMLLVGIIAVYVFNADSEKIGVIEEFKRFGIGLFTYTYNFREVYNIFVLHRYLPETPMTYPHLWYVSFDLQLCIMIFLFIAFIRNRDTLLKVSVVMVIVTIALRFIGWNYLETIPGDTISRIYILEKLPFFQMDTIFYGFILCLYDFKKSKKLFAVLILAVIIGYGYAFFRAYTLSNELDLPLRTTLREDIHIAPMYGMATLDSSIAFCIFILFACIINFPEKFKFISNSLMVKIGGLSLTMYIFQFLFIIIGMFVSSAIFRRFLPGVLADTLGLILFIALDYWCAGFIYKTFEKPIHKKIDEKLSVKKDKTSA